MKHYVGVKLVQAEPMEKDGKEGYKVVYPDGYESWSPKEVFEKSYFFCLNEECGKAWLEELSTTMEAIQEIAEWVSICIIDGKN